MNEPVKASQYHFGRWHFLDILPTQDVLFQERGFRAKNAEHLVLDVLAKPEAHGLGCVADDRVVEL